MSKNKVKIPDVKKIRIVKQIKVTLFLASDLNTSLNNLPISPHSCLSKSKYNYTFIKFI